MDHFMQFMKRNRFLTYGLPFVVCYYAAWVQFCCDIAISDLYNKHNLPISVLPILGRTLEKLVAAQTLELLWTQCNYS